MKKIAFLGLLGLSLAAIAPAQNTKFLAWDEEFSDYGDWAVQNFRLSGRRQFRLRAATDYKADVVVIPANQLDEFQDGEDFFGYGFDDSFGNQTITLNAGNYYLAVRNQADGYNYARVELDHLLLTLPGYRFNSWGISDTDYLEPRYRYWSEFYVASGSRYFADGANVGLKTYVMKSSQLTRFKRGQSFSYYTAYSRNNTDMPGFYELKLTPGYYVLGFQNPYNDDTAFTYETERWSRSSAPSFNALPAPVQVGGIQTKSGKPVKADTEIGLNVLGASEATHPGFGDSLVRAFQEKPKLWAETRNPNRALPAKRETALVRAFGAGIGRIQGR